MAKQRFSNNKIKKETKEYFTIKSFTYKKGDEITPLATSAVMYSLDMWINGNYGDLSSCVQQELDNLFISNSNLMIIRTYYLESPQSEKTLQDCEINFFEDIYNICGSLIKEYSLKQSEK